MSFGTAYATKKRGQKCMAKGGRVEDHSKMSGKSGMVRTDTEANQNSKGVNRHGHKGSSGGISEAGAYHRDYGSQPEKQSTSFGKEKASYPKEIHKQTLSELRSMPKPNLPMAEGGEIEDDMHGEQTEAEMLDMVGRIMKKHYASGGDVGGDEPEGNDAIALPKFSEGGKVANDVGVSEADELPAEYDDLVLRDDFEDDAPAGNEHGDEHQYKRDMDVVAKIMSSRKKKDKMPRPA
jgi:hypothetical protein